MRKTLLLATAATALLLCGCETDNSTATSNRSAGVPRGAHTLIAADKINAISPGMTGEQVTGLLGKPDRTEAYADGGPTGQIWSYNIAVTERVDQISTGIREVPSWDPVANQATTIREPILTNRRSRRYTTLELLFVDGKLLQRRPGQNIDLQID